jgi:hypothetical protein
MVQSMSEHKQNQIQTFLENKINYVSTTISPAPSDKEKNLLESIELGLDFYFSRGIKKVIIEPKYMGSRCQMYLDLKNPQKSFSVSRNGFKIRLDLNEIYESLVTKFKTMSCFKKAKKILLDGELMPWSAMGVGLIEGHFNTISKGIENELSFLKNNGFYEQLEVLKLTKVNEFIDQKLATELDEMEYMVTYQKQMELYGKQTAIHYKPFKLLKVYFEDDTEVLGVDFFENEEENFKTISEDKYIVIDSTQIDIAIDFFNTLTFEEGHEGVVIKPYNWCVDNVECMKVRNESYLSIIYGYNYKQHYKELVAKKRTSPKIRKSTNETKLAFELLQVNENDILESNERYMRIIKKLLFEIDGEKTIDGRL